MARARVVAGTLPSPRDLPGLYGNVYIDKRWAFAYCSVQSLAVQRWMMNGYGVVPRKRRVRGADGWSPVNGVARTLAPDCVPPYDRQRAGHMEHRQPGTIASGRAASRTATVVSGRWTIFSPSRGARPWSR